jgi:hypothetical protein
MSTDDPQDAPWYAPGRTIPKRAAVAGELIWRLAQKGRTLRCEIRDQSRVGAGWDVQVLDGNNHPLITQRLDHEDLARNLANELRDAFGRDGWRDEVESLDSP